MQHAKARVVSSHEAHGKRVHGTARICMNACLAVWPRALVEKLTPRRLLGVRKREEKEMV